MTSHQMLHGNMDDLCPTLEAESIDAVVTDPPYPKEHLPLFGQLAQHAARLLKPGGSCIVLTGQSYLPQVLGLMTPHLRYHWTLAYLTPGGQAAQLWQRKVNTFWKPLLWLVKGEYTGPWIGDVSRSKPNDNDKRFHHWGQSETGMFDLIQRVTQPGQRVLDPFAGAGTTGLACIRAGRSFVGIELDEKKFLLARDRLLADDALSDLASMQAGQEPLFR